LHIFGSFKVRLNLGKTR